MYFGASWRYCSLILLAIYAYVRSIFLLFCFCHWCLYMSAMRLVLVSIGLVQKQTS